MRKAADTPQQGGQVFAVHVLHGEEGVAVHFTHVVHAADVGMRDAARNPYFVAETFQQAFVARGFFGEELERDGLAESKVVGAVNLAHATFAEQGDDAVAACE